ncbi:MAG: hypothetical protein LW832_00205, partial [Parachlamydia sp.]|nr:hypothetical protein [Parachlamydia sp.]
MTHTLATHVLEELLRMGIREFCVSPGARNAPLIYALTKLSSIRVYFWPEERSSAFFALGRIKATGIPAAVITTSGTAAAEILPAAIEAYYTGAPLILITADRPKRYRGTGAPQSIEQVGLFSHYVHYELDLEEDDSCTLIPWHQKGPAHLNLCFEEPGEADCQQIEICGTPAAFIPLQSEDAPFMDKWEQWKLG